MGDETTQTTPISKAEYKRFKQFVQDTHGTTRGHLRTEIENALREYRQPDEAAEPMVRVEDDIAQIKAMLADSQADGGTTPQTPEAENTHARAETGKPEPNAPKSDKIEYLITEYYNREGGQVAPEAIENQIKDEFGFGRRTVKAYQERILDELGAEKHPDHGNFWVWGDALDRAKEQYEKKLRGESDDG